VPGFNPIQEYKDYDVRMHHTNVDLYERVREQDLKQNAVVMAWFAWQAATTADESHECASVDILALSAARGQCETSD